jgi:hypothetical protein
VRPAVRRALAQERVQPGVPQVLQRLPLRAGGHGGEQGDMRQVLHGLDHARQQDQVPVKTSPFALRMTSLSLDLAYLAHVMAAGFCRLFVAFCLAFQRMLMA